ncbi:uncharacterized protein MELLADRAFT_96163 [Melampsora larici-populina 98AG31]|uniref:FCP1 homology domain-containing protein n=1 Tax=Melampsora larici-populina (strain 98AG31 / pathotype 3-4-7) TaxID=747676 RepID=F4SB72_MELLP|nr:uncharacterized protein MELLADRAFT_96163 [Melampsora larici-populina 98AG31]EGF98098.1 hypothetical protein MELLADRAFT_96163 [Melampsora larici-populina 98AG31]
MTTQLWLWTHNAMPETNESPLPTCLDIESTSDKYKSGSEDQISKRPKLDDESTKASSSSAVLVTQTSGDAERETPIGFIPEQGDTSFSGANQGPPVASGSGLAEYHDERSAMESEKTEPCMALNLVFSWRNDNLELQIDKTETIGDLKVMIYSLTAVTPERQKILGLVPGKLPLDDVLLSTIEFKMKRGAHFTLLGTPEENTILRSQDGTKATNDQAHHPVSANDCVLYLPQVQAKLQELSSTFDFSVHALDMTRPYLHEFLTALWPYYDICIWSATSWRWLESKLVELQMVGGKYIDKYLIQFVLDRGPMFEVTSIRHGKVARHEVKALELIWRAIPEYNATNTLHLDDLSRNFVLNPTSGVKISPFKYARENKHDRQLVFLTRYFLQMALQPDVRIFDHRHWAKCTLPLPPGVRDPLHDLDPQDPELIKFLQRHPWVKPEQPEQPDQN